MKVKIRKTISIGKKQIKIRYNEIDECYQYNAISINEMLTKVLPTDGYAMMGILFKDIYSREDEENYSKRSFGVDLVGLRMWLVGIEVNVLCFGYNIKLN